MIPYTSIIEQNAKVFSDILGERNVLEHHSNMILEDEEGEAARRHYLAAENWDAPVVVTTAVQFFESLHSAKTSRCRKLHNIANSVVIFDEAQMLPLNYLVPCVDAIAELVRHYRVTAVLCTATQPALGKFIRDFAPDMPVAEICPEYERYSEQFRRVSYRWDGVCDDELLAEKLCAAEQCLCILNTRKHARELSGMLPEEGGFHLSTFMTPEHRKRVLNEIRQRLRDGMTCRVVSTSLIEAGVDVDFPEVWREEAGLDSILQAAGRCNREGKRPMECSVVHIFRGEGAPMKGIAQHIAAMNMATEGSRQPDGQDVIRRYFDLLYNLRGESLDMKGIVELEKRFQFRKVSEEFRMIESDTVTIYVPNEENAEDIRRLQQGMYSRALLRRLGRCCVNVYRQHFRALYDAGKLAEYDGFYVLSDLAAYDAQYGIETDAESGRALLI